MAVGEELGLDEARVDVMGAEREGEEEASYGGCELAREAPRKSREQARSHTKQGCAVNASGIFTAAAGRCNGRGTRLRGG